MVCRSSQGQGDTTLFSREAESAPLQVVYPPQPLGTGQVSVPPWPPPADPWLLQEVVEVTVESLNTTAGAQLVVATHPLPYYSDVVWTVLGDTGTLQVGGGGQWGTVGDSGGQWGTVGDSGGAGPIIRIQADTGICQVRGYTG